MTGPIHLRDCPMCKAPPKDESGPQLTSINGIDLSTGEDFGALWYSVTCLNCSVSVSDEYLSETLRLWNGEPDPNDEEDEE
jgi:hypothetical protein